MANAEVDKMNLKFLLTTDACDTSSSSSGEAVCPPGYAAKAIVAVIPGSPVSQKGLADFVRVPVGMSDQTTEQSADHLPPAAMCDSNIRPTNHRREALCNGDPRMESWLSSVSRLHHASNDCAHPPRHSTHAQFPAAVEPWQSITTSHHDHQPSTGSHRSTLRPPKASFSIRKHGKEKGASSKTHTCFCGRAFNKREHLKRHNLLVHQELRPFTCEDCDRHFGTKQNFQVHLSTRKHRQRVLFQQPATRENSSQAVGNLRDEESAAFRPAITDQSANQ